MVSEQKALCQYIRVGCNGAKRSTTRKWKRVGIECQRRSWERGSRKEGNNESNEQESYRSEKQEKRKWKKMDGGGCLELLPMNIPRSKQGVNKGHLCWSQRIGRWDWVREGRMGVGRTYRKERGKTSGWTSGSSGCDLGGRDGGRNERWEES